jgi:LCP family protein required for cell wall assembly
VLMVGRVDFAERQIRVVNVPRNLLVEIPGHGHDLINAAYNTGRVANPEDSDAGAELVRQTVARAFRMRIDDHFFVDFVAFRKMINILGGIEVDVPHEIRDESSGFRARFRAGRQVLLGQDALTYARTRRADGDGWRRQRQLDIVVALYERMLQVRSPLTLFRVLREARTSIKTSLSTRRMIALGLAVARIPRHHIGVANIAKPIVVPGPTPDGRVVMRADPDVLLPYVHELLDLVGPAQRRREPPLRKPARPREGRLRRRRSPTVAYRMGKAMRPDVAVAFDRLADAAQREGGHSIYINSALRTDAEQMSLFGARPDRRWVAPPGQSLHRYGTELDLGPPTSYPWLAENAHRFGFVRRYEWEPWHFGYDGDADQAASDGDAAGASRVGARR